MAGEPSRREGRTGEATLTGATIRAGAWRGRLSYTYRKVSASRRRRLSSISSAATSTSTTHSPKYALRSKRKSAAARALAELLDRRGFERAGEILVRWSQTSSRIRAVPSVLDNGIRSPRALLAAVVRRLVAALRR
jgi:hypothetical protein